MTYEHFLEIKEQYKDLNIHGSPNLCYDLNRNCFLYQFNSKGAEKDYFKQLINTFNYNGNSIRENLEGYYIIIQFIKHSIFTEEQWKVIVPYINFEEFNADYLKLEEKVLPLFGKLYKWRKDLHLEFWQGIFSFGTHWIVKGLSPKESINSKKNGEQYCNILLEIYPILKEFLEEHPSSHYTLMQRLS